MKQRITERFWFKPNKNTPVRTSGLRKLMQILFVLIFLTSCGGNSTENSIVDKNSSEVIKTEDVGNTEISNNSGKFFYINNPQNENLAEIVIEQTNMTLKMPQGNLYGKLKGEKRKYYDGSNQLQNTVKYKSAESFKLRNQDEQLLWKVKIYEDKIKVSNNEEMESPYEVRLYDDKMKVKRNGEELHVIRFDETDQFTKVGNEYVVREFGKSYALGILLIDDIPRKERFLLCAELLKMGK
ncbi:MAG: hypothetical protein ACI85I_000207 [Arenicella sp.]|jgi:hypothetical protein